MVRLYLKPFVITWTHHYWAVKYKGWWDKIYIDEISSFDFSQAEYAIHLNS